MWHAITDYNPSVDSVAFSSPDLPDPLLCTTNKNLVSDTFFGTQRAKLYLTIGSTAHHVSNTHKEKRRRCAIKTQWLRWKFEWYGSDYVHC